MSEVLIKAAGDMLDILASDSCDEDEFDATVATLREIKFPTTLTEEELEWPPYP